MYMKNKRLIGQHRLLTSALAVVMSISMAVPVPAMAQETTVGDAAFMSGTDIVEESSFTNDGVSAEESSFTNDDVLAEESVFADETDITGETGAFVTTDGVTDEISAGKSDASDVALAGVTDESDPDDAFTAADGSDAIDALGAPGADLTDNTLFDISFKDEAADPYDGMCYNDEKKHYEIVYQGDDYKPSIYVQGKYGRLSEDTDYTISYEDKPRINKDGLCYRLIITGKGNFTGSKTVDYYIIPADLSIAKEKGLLFAPDTICVTAGSTVTPLVVYRGQKLTDEDIFYKKLYKYYSDEKLTITPVQNSLYFSGSLEDIDVKIVTKDYLDKYSIKPSYKLQKHCYNGEEQTLGTTAPEDYLTPSELTVKIANNITPLKEDVDYKVYYYKNLDAGTACAVIYGTGDYYGFATKQFKILPDKTSEITAELTDPETVNYYTSAGAKPDVTVTIHRESGDEILTKNVDYKVSYSGNKKVGTATYTVSFIKNFSGHPAIKKVPFEVSAARIEEATVICPNLFYGKKPAAYRSKPIVVIDGRTIGTAEYTVTYLDGETELGKKDKIALADDENSKVITVRITGRKHYDGVVDGTYMVVRKTIDAVNMSKVKIVAFEKNGKGKDVSIPKQTYTADPIYPELRVLYKVGKVWLELDPDEYEVYYYANINKGTGRIILNGKGAAAIGCKKGSFGISAKDITMLKLD